MTAQDKYTSIGLSSVQSKCDFKVLSYVSSIILERLKNIKNGGQKSPWAWEWFKWLSVKNIWKKTIHRHKSTCHPRQIYKKSFQFIIFIKWRQCVFPWCWWGHISDPISLYSILLFFPEGKSRASSADCESTESSSSDDEEVFVKKCQKQKCQQNNPSEKLQKSRPRWSSINKRLRKRRPKASKREKKILEGLKNENTTSTHRQSRSPKRKTKIVKNTTRRFFSLPSLNEESNRIENLDHDRRKLKKNIFLKSHKPSLAIWESKSNWSYNY